MELVFLDVELVFLEVELLFYIWSIYMADLEPEVSCLHIHRFTIFICRLLVRPSVRNSSYL